ncbi:hypothetical protein HYPSUDRAFT_571610 [Hypholoma sublateritium FD-334 SS-4]|uniref:F-box domain-containing protein n=1 Tax=Hypholoma sublateritium (strain FD-334 SS-4) TaxID=945553 RepID=A0A0D2L981_HYPSF|nr:hypothetical protein HYPSUDRAFT_571610 [Hypholoma sublateritium FD-334 SS-4]
MEEALAWNQTRQSKLDEKIMRLHMQKSALTAEDAGHRAALVLCQKIHAPIRRLSFDVLSEIAWHCIPSQPIGQSNSSRRSKMHKRFPFVFTHVCSSWRAAALSSPRIWTTLHLTIGKMYSSVSMNNLTQIMEEWFGRARQLPLSLFLYIDDSAYDFRRYMMSFRADNDETRLESPLGHFLTSLSPFIPRFERLSIRSQQKECLRAILAHPVTWDLRNLQSLHIRSSAYYSFSGENTPDRTNSHLFIATPVLTHLNLDCMVARHAELKHTFPWSQLTHLNIPTSMSVPDWVTVMDLCTSLKTAKFALADFAPTNFPLRRSSSTHDDLESLSFHLPSSNPCSYSPLELLRAFRLPNLKHLDTSRDSSRHEETSTQAPHEDTRTFVSLQRLSFFDNHYDCLPRLLKETPNLRELSMATYGTFPIALLATMTYTPHSEFSPNLNILPYLGTLILAFNDQMDAPNLAVLKKMLLSRTNETIPIGCRPLKEVTILVRDEDGISDLKVVVEELCNEVSGVNIVLKQSSGLWYDTIPKYVSI